MSFWWVNHSQTARVEINEGYIWSPQKNKNNSKNETYLNLTRVKIGEIIFSYANGKISTVGKVIDEAEEEERPLSFGATGNQWDKKGWMVKVKWIALNHPFLPKNHLTEIVPLLPTRNSPIRQDGNGNQICYLAEISKELGYLVLNLIDDEPGIMWELKDIETDIESTEEEKNIQNSALPSTQREQLIQARIGQGLFRMNVEKIETRCRITGLTYKRLLIASHIKSWKDSTNNERLDGHNGFLMSPHVDRLFDKGFISFSKKGGILISDEQTRSILLIWAIDPLKNVGVFTSRQSRYLEYHRDVIFKRD